MYQKPASDSPHIVALNEMENEADVYAYVSENLNQMADQGFFGINMDRSSIAQVAARSNGVFLWASLLLRYLSSPSLSPDERREALEQAHLLEGLEALYHNILSLLSRRNQREKLVAIDIFRWLSLSIRRLCIPGIQVALAITPGQPTTEDQYFAEFNQSIPHLTGGLVEITDCSVLFTHRSVKEYLQSPLCQDSEFSIHDESTVHAHLAAKCIYFLANNVPKRPLHRLQHYSRPAAPNRFTTNSGTLFRTSQTDDSEYKSMSSGSAFDTDGIGPPTPDNSRTTPTPAFFDNDIPFLRYAALCWPIHLTRALSNVAPQIASVTDTTISPLQHAPWLPALLDLLTDRLAVTAWVEASWRYSLPPNISRLIPLLVNLKSEIPPATIQGRELRWVVSGLRQLSDALVELREGYGTTVGENPSLLWQGTAQTTQGTFWPVWDELRGVAYVEGERRL
ncbi:hypothetical protein K504DRAFT_461026, partial [Pleomassaria siparia CBS 279.74]